MATPRQQTILVVDDQDVILEFMADLLREAGYLVQTATNGTQALERIQVSEPDLVVTDVSMPAMDGWQLLQAIRSRLSNGHLPVILMSAGTRLPFHVADLDSFTAFLEKPFGIGAMLEMIERLLRSSSDAGDPSSLRNASDRAST